jgi:hypothetical protein
VKNFPGLTKIIATHLLVTEKLNTEVETIRVTCGTTKGDIDMDIKPKWAPYGAKRFLDMVKSKYFDGSAFFRNLAGFIIQFGLAADPKDWRAQDDKGLLRDDPKLLDHFPRGGISFAGSVLYSLPLPSLPPLSPLPSPTPLPQFEA